MRFLKRGVACALFCFLAVGALPALTIKLGTLVPPGSAWELNLKWLAAEWAKISKNRVVLKIYSGGRAGDEQDMLRKMRFNQLQAVGLSIAGLSQVHGAVLAPAIPMLVENEAELSFVLEKMKPALSKEFEKKGFKILFWNLAGWAYFFSRYPIVFPSDLKNQKMWVMAGNTDEANTWKRMGYRVVTFSTLDMLVQLQTGGVDAFVTSPIIAASNQWFGIAKNMSGFSWAPFYGAFLISTRTWNRIPKELHARLQEAAEQCSERMNKETKKANRDAIEVMEKYGLIINDTSEGAIEAWRDLAENGVSEFVGGKFEMKYYEQAKEYLDEYRKLGQR